MVLQRRRSTTHTVVLSPMGDTGLTVAEKPPALLSYIQDRQAMGMSISAISEELYSHADRAGVGCVSLSELHSSLSREEVRVREINALASVVIFIVVKAGGDNACKWL